MEQLLTTVPAHFDGKEIKLDVPIKLAPNAQLLVVILEPHLLHQNWVQAAMQASNPVFTRIWDNSEDGIYDDL
jgi:hypothetical protein